MSAARAMVVVSFLAALVVFAVVQDRVTAGGARAYVASYRATPGRGEAPSIDEVMRPAIGRSVRQGSLWAGVVLVAGIGAAAAAGRRRVSS